MKKQKKLALQQFERRLDTLRGIQEQTNIRTGWIAYVREAMLMTLGHVAKRASLSTSTVQQIEKRERSGKVTITTMRKIADAMECDFVYAIVPRQKLSVFLQHRALAKARNIVEQADVHMTLENQRVVSSVEERIERVASELLAKGDIW